MKYSEYFSAIKSILNRPFPESESLSSYIRTMLIIGGFVSLFLGIIKPFNIEQSGTVWIYALIFGVITFVAGMSYELILRFIFKINKAGSDYTLLSWIIQVVGLLLFIAIFNYLFTAYAFGMPLSVFPYMIWSTFLIGVFPTVFIGTISMLKREKINSEIAESINNKPIASKSKTVELSIFDILTDQIWYIESLQNYVNVYHWNGTEIEKKTERATLKSCGAIIQNTDLLKCHRSYIVNTSKIENVSGNAQGLKLKLLDYDVLIPVSRSYIPLFKA